MGCIYLTFLCGDPLDLQWIIDGDQCRSQRMRDRKDQKEYHQYRYRSYHFDGILSSIPSSADMAEIRDSKFKT
jgi:hypothetical protein